jgi:hypothetical protein
METLINKQFSTPINHIPETVSSDAMNLIYLRLAGMIVEIGTLPDGFEGPIFLMVNCTWPSDVSFQ